MPLYLNGLYNLFETDKLRVYECQKPFANPMVMSFTYLHLIIYLDIDLKGKRIYWHEFAIEDRIIVKSNGIPFVMMGRKVYDCHHGKDRNVALKHKNRLKRQEVIIDSNTKSRVLCWQFRTKRKVFKGSSLPKIGMTRFCHSDKLKKAEL